MSGPAPLHFPHPPPPPPPSFAAYGNDSAGFMPPEIPIVNDHFRPLLQPGEFPPFKKPRNNEDILVPNHPKMPPPTKGSRIFFKTRPCPKFREGTCPYGTNCNFAHGIEDMRRPPSNWQDMVGSNGEDRMVKWEEDLKIITRHRLCKNYYNGRMCPYGERCNYIHEDPSKFRDELGRSRENSVISISTAGAALDNGARSEQSDAITISNSSHDADRMNGKYMPWKVRMCNKWETLGNCPFGDKCHFAHGLAELKRYGGYNEVEAGNARPAPPKPVTNPASDASVNNIVKGTSCKTQVLSKFLLKWKTPEKINRIYADWIDDVATSNRSPSKLEN